MGDASHPDRAERPQVVDPGTVDAEAVGSRGALAAPSNHQTAWDRSRIILIVGAALLVLIGIGLRWELRSYVSGDMKDFVIPWFDYLRRHGISAFGENFSNYNFPYPFLLYIVSRFPVSAVTGIKLLSMAFDLVLVGATVLLARQVSGSWLRAGVAGVGVLYLPTVVLDSAQWGQADSVYVSIGILSIYFALRRKSTVAWILIGVALAVKIQAIFFLPLLVLLWLRRRTRLLSPLWAVGSWIVLTIPPILFGRPLGEVLGVYLTQAGTYRWLTIGVANAYAWLPGADFDLFKSAGTFFALGVLGLLILIGYVANPLTDLPLMLFGTTTAAAAVFVLPQMHERYTYAYEILVVVLVVTVPRWLWLLAASQMAAIWGYTRYLLGTPYVPEWVAGLLLGAVMIGLMTLWATVLVKQRSDRPESDATSHTRPEPHNVRRTA